MTGAMASKYGAPDLAYEIAFYSKGERETAPASVDPLVEGLKVYLGQVKGAIVMETRLKR